jgi:hypothetical protein
VGVLGLRNAADRISSEHGHQPALERPLVQFDIEPDREPADHVEQLLQRNALAIEQ